MDLRVWQWRSPWEKRTYLLYSLFYLCLLLREHVTAADAVYRQESKNEAQDSANKLDFLSNYLPYSTEDSDYYNHKRGSSSAFFPLRGKKPYSDDSSPTSPHRSEEEDKRSQFYPLRGKKVPDDLKRASSYFMPMRGRKDAGWTPEVDYDITDESPDKRASSFMPMRGKKRYAAISDYLNNRAGTYPSRVLNPSASEHHELSNDTKADSFARGKRSYHEEEKSSTTEVVVSSAGDNDTTVAAGHSARKRSVAFMPMRGRRDDGLPRGVVTSLLDKKDHKSASATKEESRENGGFDKRAVFMPMRGRRFTDEDDYEESKRARTFMPMRGRRTQMRDVVYEGSSVPELESRLIEDKRASSFMPMRGRKSEADFDKRRSAFTLMRGRRSVSYLEDAPKRGSFVPMRGRRSASYLEDSPNRGPFVPMRGRISAADDEFEVEPWPAEHLMSLLDKKSSAFMPMRGRRVVPRENFTVDPWPAEQLMSLFNKRATFLPMRGRRGYTEDEYESDEYSEPKRSSPFMPMRGRREMNFYNPYPYLMAGIGSSLMSKPFGDHGVTYNSVRSADDRRKKLMINWDSVKRAFHATRGKRFQEVDDFVQSPKNSSAEDDSAEDSIHQQTRRKRSIIRPRVAIQPSRQYIALKRPMSFFATRGKRLDDSAIDKLSNLR